MIQYTFFKIFMAKYHLQFRCLLIHRPSNQDNIFLLLLFVTNRDHAIHKFIYCHEFMNNHTLYYHKFMTIYFASRYWWQKIFEKMFYYLTLHVVRGIMVENEPNIYIADKSMKFVRDVCFGIVIRKKIGPTWKSTLDAFWHHKNTNIFVIFNFLLSEPI